MVYFSNIVWIIFPFFIAILFTCYVFSCGLPINSFWSSGVSREIKTKRKITLSYVICKGKDLDIRCPEIRTAPTRRTIIAMKELHDLPVVCIYPRIFYPLGSSARRTSVKTHPAQNSVSTSLPRNPQVKFQIRYYLSIPLLYCDYFK